MLLILISVILDGILSALIPLNSIFRPKLTITAIYFLYSKYKKNKTSYFILLIITGIVYDLLYTNILWLHPIIFYLLGNFIKYIKDNYNKTPTIIGLVLTIIFYETLIFILMSIFQITKTNIISLLIIIGNSLLLNVLYLKTMQYIKKIKHN